MAQITLKINAPCSKSTALSCDVLLVSSKVVHNRLHRVHAVHVVTRLVDDQEGARRIIEVHGLDGGLETAGVRDVVQALGAALLRVDLLWSF